MQTHRVMNWISHSCKNWNLNDYSLSFIILTSIIFKPLAPLGFIFWSLTIWFNKAEHPFKKNIKFHQSIELWFLIYYLLLLVGMIWTENSVFGMSKLENKLSFLVFPILFTFSKLTLSKKKIIDLFISGLLISLLIHLGIAVFKSIYYPEDNHWGYFIDSQFTVLMHRSYFSAYLVMGSMLCLYRSFKSQKIDYNVLLFSIFAIGSFQTLSKAGIVTFCVLFPSILFFSLLKWKKWKVLISSIVFLFLGFIFIVSSDNILIQRFKKIPEAFENIKFENNASVESNTSRLLMWNTSWEVIKENSIIGTGTGDYDDALHSKNMSLGNSGVGNKHFNSHNQFLNTTVQLGILGLFVLVALFVYAIRYSYSNRLISSIIIVVCFLLNFLFESFLETQAGIVLFCVLLIALNSEKLNANSNEIEYL